MEQKKFKLVFDVEKLVKEGKATIIPEHEVQNSFRRINAEMKKAHRDFRRKSKMSELRASKIILNS